MLMILMIMMMMMVIVMMMMMMMMIGVIIDSTLRMNEGELDPQGHQAIKAQEPLY